MVKGLLNNVVYTCAKTLVFFVLIAVRCTAVLGLFCTMPDSLQCAICAAMFYFCLFAVLKGFTQAGCTAMFHRSVLQWTTSNGCSSWTG